MIILPKRFDGLQYMVMEGGCVRNELRNFLKRLAFLIYSMIDWKRLENEGKVTHVMYKSLTRAMLVGVWC